MPESYCPRLAEARTLLPTLRGHLIAAASRYPLPGPLAIELIPIVDDGLFGYELITNPEARVYLIVGVNEAGIPTMRRTCYGAEPSSALRLVTVDGRAVTRSGAGTCQMRGRDSSFPDWPSVAASAWGDLGQQPTERGRHYAVVNEGTHRFLDAALEIAHSHLTPWNPRIRFFGLPKEAQHGFTLFCEAGGHGELISQRPDMWILRWKCNGDAIYEEWSVGVQDAGAASELTRA